MYLWLVDLAELPELPRWLRPFARFEGRDHFSPQQRGTQQGRTQQSETIRSKLDSWLAEHDIDLAGGQVLMLASARVLGYVFNPITVYWCHDQQGELVCVVAEVHNTYHGRHAYLLNTDEHGVAYVDKEFYVSPFQPVEGAYRMRLPRPDSLLALTVALRRDQRKLLTATLRGVKQELTVRGLLRMLIARPLMPQRVSMLIRKHGIVLWAKRAAITPREPNIVEGELNGRTSAAA